MIFEVQKQLEELIMDLTALKTTPGKHMRKFVDQLKVQERKFDDSQLKGQVYGVEWSSGGFIIDL